MSFDDLSDVPFQKLQEEHQTKADPTDAKCLENERIEAVLIKLNSRSSAFQFRTMAMFYSFYFFLGLHSLTFPFMFILPDFFYRSQDGQGRPSL